MKRDDGCAQCGRTTFAMFQMAGGNELPPFWLCQKCWLDGVKTKRAQEGK